MLISSPTHLDFRRNRDRGRGVLTARRQVPKSAPDALRAPRLRSADHAHDTRAVRIPRRSRRASAHPFIVVRRVHEELEPETQDGHCSLDF